MKQDKPPGAAAFRRQAEIILKKKLQRQHTIKALQKSEETYRDILSTTPDGFWLVDFQGNLLDVNDSYIRQSGYSREELLGMHPYDLDVQETAAETAAHMSRMIETDQAKFETIHRRKDGSTWHVEITVGVTNRAEGRFVAFLRDITARKMADTLILRSLHEKEVLLKEVHHRVKNNMQIIFSLLSLQAKRVADPTTRLMFDESMNRVSSMALIHERLYHSKDLTNIDFKGYLQSLVDAISSIYHCPNVTCTVEMETLFLDVNAGIPCGLIANELISNSFKHGFPDGSKGVITVAVCKNIQGEYVLTVKDNGIGYPPNIDFKTTSSLGMQLVNGLTAQLHGTMELSTVDGTKFSITFPGTL
jgi:PAS domain S-box-containing protein